jgi:hypothetical protein
MQSCGIGTGRKRAPGKSSAKRDSAGYSRLVDCAHLRQVTLHEPKLLRHRGVEREDHDFAARDAPQLGDACLQIRPVMDGEHGERGVERLIQKRQALGAREDTWRGIGRALHRHHFGRLHRDDLAMRRFVGTRAGTHVHNSPRVVERCRNARDNAWIGPACRGVTSADLVVNRPLTA